MSDARSRFLHSAAWKADPAEMMRDAGFDPDPHQVELLYNRDPQTLVLWPRQSGKSQTCASLVLHQACYDAGDIVILAGKKQKQAEEVFEKAMAMHERLSKLGDLPCTVSRTSEEATFSNGSRILAQPSSVESVRGYAAKLALIDEAAFTDDGTLAKISPMLAATHGRLICPSTPNGARGWFHDAWHDGGEAWTRLTVSIDKLPRLTAQEIARQRSLLTPNQFRQEFLLEWLDTDQQLFSTEIIEAALCDDIVPLFERFLEAA